MITGAATEVQRNSGHPRSGRSPWLGFPYQLRCEGRSCGRLGNDHSGLGLKGQLEAQLYPVQTPITAICLHGCALLQAAAELLRDVYHTVRDLLSPMGELLGNSGTPSRKVTARLRGGGNLYQDLGHSVSPFGGRPTLCDCATSPENAPAMDGQVRIAAASCISTVIPRSWKCLLAALAHLAALSGLPLAASSFARENSTNARRRVSRILTRLSARL
jgi:hypothetical protein